MHCRIRIFLAIFCLCLLAPPSFAAPDSLSRFTQQWTGDLTDLLTHKHPIRVLVSYNRTNFFAVRGQMRGLEYDLMTAYQKHLATTHKKEHARMVFVSVPFDQLIPALLDGRGDIIAAGLTDTPQRRKKVAFSAPYRTGINEIIVGSKRAPKIDEISDLAGKKVHVMAGSSYVGHLGEISAQLKQRGMKPIKIIEADANLVTEDLLEMTERGIIKYAAADSHIATIWKSALPNLQLFTDASIHSGGDLAWAVRPNSPELVKSLSEFAATVRQGTLMGNMVFKRYYVNDEWVKNPITETARKDLEPMVEIFKKYATKYEFDWLKIAALAFQESRLHMNKKSSMGAVGVMQIKPSTAADPNVGVPNVKTLDGNIHAGVKYLRFLRDRYFKDVEHDAKVDFALAAYNAGPGRVMQFRKKAKSMGLDPNTWFGNVEWAAYEMVGPETPTYVANVQMYYAAYKSMYTVMQGRRDAQ